MRSSKKKIFLMAKMRILGKKFQKKWLRWEVREKTFFLMAKIRSSEKHFFLMAKMRSLEKKFFF